MGRSSGGWMMFVLALVLAVLTGCDHEEATNAPPGTWTPIRLIPGVGVEGYDSSGFDADSFDTQNLGQWYCLHKPETEWCDDIPANDFELNDIADALDGGADAAGLVAEASEKASDLYKKRGTRDQLVLSEDDYVRYLDDLDAVRAAVEVEPLTAKQNYTVVDRFGNVVKSVKLSLCVPRLRVVRGPFHMRIPLLLC